MHQELTPLQRLTCPHSLLDQTVPDEDGCAICLRCGAAIQVRLTLAVLQRAMEQMR